MMDSSSVIAVSGAAVAAIAALGCLGAFVRAARNQGVLNGKQKAKIDALPTPREWGELKQKVREMPTGREMGALTQQITDAGSRIERCETRIDGFEASLKTFLDNWPANTVGQDG